MRPEHAVLGILLGSLPFLAESPAALIAVYALAFIPYAMVLRASTDIRVVIGLALVFRIFLSLFEPILSDDLYRYVWEGRVSLAGLNPFSLAPSDAALTHLRDSWIWPSVNHPEIPTIYPPISQAIFALNAIWEGGTTSMRLVFVAIELGLVALATRWLTAGERNIFLPAYLLNPLIVVELGWSGHLDVVAYMSVLVALLIWQRGGHELRWVLAAGLMLGLSISAKFLGVMALGLMLLTPGPRTLQNRATLAVLSVAVVGVSYGPFLGAGAELFSGFGTYAASWRSNDMVFRAIYSATEFGLQLGHSDKLVFEVLGRSVASDQVAATAGKGIAVLVLMIVFGFAVAVIRDSLYGFLLLMLTLLIMAPTVHPWYVAWLVPFAVLSVGSRALGLSALLWSASVVLAYTAWHSYHGGGPWTVPHWAVAIQAFSLIMGLWRIKRGSVFEENESK